VTWAAATGGAGLAGYEVQHSSDGGRTWRTLSLPRATSTTTTATLSPGSHRFRVRATDTRGVVGTWATGSAFTLRIQQQSAAIYRSTERWATTRQSGALGGSIAQTRTAGATATIRLTAGHLSWVGTTAPNRGKAEVLIDGRRHAVLDLYSPTTRTRVVLFTTALSPGSHTLTIRALGKRRGAASDSYIDTDAFITRS